MTEGGAERAAEDSERDDSQALALSSDEIVERKGYEVYLLFSKRHIVIMGARFNIFIKGVFILRGTVFHFLACLPKVLRTAHYCTSVYI